MLTADQDSRFPPGRTWFVSGKAPWGGPDFPITGFQRQAPTTSYLSIRSLPFTTGSRPSAPLLCPLRAPGLNDSLTPAVGNPGAYFNGRASRQPSLCPRHIPVPVRTDKAGKYFERFLNRGQPQGHSGISRQFR